MNVNEPESRGGLPAVLTALGALAVVVLALIGVAAVFELIPREALQVWLTKAALVAVGIGAVALVHGLYDALGPWPSFALALLSFLVFVGYTRTAERVAERLQSPSRAPS